MDWVKGREGRTNTLKQNSMMEIKVLHFSVKNRRFNHERLLITSKTEKFMENPVSGPGPSDSSSNGYSNGNGNGHSNGNGNGRGRPSTFKPVYCKRAVDYFLGAVTDGTHNYFPTDPGLAALLGTSKARIYDWANKFPDFREALDIGHSFAESIMHDGAMSGRYNAGYSKFLAINAYGMVSENTVAKSDVALSTPQGLQINFVRSDSTGGTNG